MFPLPFNAICPDCGRDVTYYMARVGDAGPDWAEGTFIVPSDIRRILLSDDTMTRRAFAVQQRFESKHRRHYKAPWARDESGTLSRRIRMDGVEAFVDDVDEETVGPSGPAMTNYMGVGGTPTGVNADVLSAIVDAMASHQWNGGKPPTPVQRRQLAQKV